MNFKQTEARGLITIPWGRDEALEVKVPEGWPAAEVVVPDLRGALGDYQEALIDAIKRPLGCSPIWEGLGELSRVAIVVDDPSRWTPVREALPVLLDRLEQASVKYENITISIGVGRHQAVDERAMRLRVGNHVFDNFKCFSPPVDDISAYNDLGTTPDGIPVRVFRPVAEADLRILIGSVLPHLQAGFGGGFKLIFPGTSHRSTLGALHARGLGTGDAARLLGGDPAENPMRHAIRSAAQLLGRCVSISHLMGVPGQVLQVRAGDPDVVQKMLVDDARQRFQAPNTEPADLIVAGNHPWPGDPMQSFKVLLQHRSACRKRGVLVGFFWTNPDEIERSFPMPAMKAIAASGQVGGWILRRGLTAADRVMSATGNSSAFMIRWARELVVDRDVLVYAPPLYERIGPRLGPVQIFGDQEALWTAAEKALENVEAPRVRVFPFGGLSYVQYI